MDRAVDVWVHGGTPLWVTIIGWIVSGVIAAGAALGTQVLARRAEKERRRADEVARTHAARFDACQAYLAPVNKLRAYLVDVDQLELPLNLRRRVAATLRQKVPLSDDEVTSLVVEARAALPPMEPVVRDLAVVGAARRAVRSLEMAVRGVRMTADDAEPPEGVKVLIRETIEQYDKFLGLMRTELGLGSGTDELPEGVGGSAASADV